MRFMYLVVMTLIILVLSSCKLANNENYNYIYYPIALSNLALEEKEKYGINLLYSPNKSKYLYTDSAENYEYIYMVENNNKSTIFEFSDIFGENEVRDMVPLSYFWKDDNTVFVVSTYSYEGPRVYEINVQDKSWIVYNIPIDGYIYGYNDKAKAFILQTSEDSSTRTYEYFNSSTGEHKKLSNFDNYIIRDYKQGKYLFYNVYNEKEIYLYDSIILKTYAITTQPPHYGNITIVPDSDNIAILVFENGGLITYNYKKDEQVDRITISEKGVSSLVGWNNTSTCFYGVDYIACKEGNNK